MVISTSGVKLVEKGIILIYPPNIILPLVIRGDIMFESQLCYDTSKNYYIRTKTWNISMDSVVVINSCNSMKRLESFRIATEFQTVY